MGRNKNLSFDFFRRLNLAQRWSWAVGINWFFLFLSFLVGFTSPPLPIQSNRIQGATIGLMDQLSPPQPYPRPKISLSEPFLTASAAAVFDRNSKVFLYQKNPDELYLPASTVKIMTGFVALEYYHPEDVVMVKNVSDLGQDMKLKDGELISAEALIYGLLVSSANDAAQILAQGFPGGETGFVAAMNLKANQLGMTKSLFKNPSGLDDVGEASYSTAREMAWLADKAMENETFARVVGTKQMVLRSPKGQYEHSLYNLNQLLWTTPGVKGVKTGWTESAGECLVTMIERDGRELIVVVLGSQDRFGESQQLVEWAFDGFYWLSPEELAD